MNPKELAEHLARLNQRSHECENPCDCETCWNEFFKDDRLSIEFWVVGEEKTWN